jgi:hypothetical protein
VVEPAIEGVRDEDTIIIGKPAKSEMFAVCLHPALPIRLSEL